MEVSSILGSNLFPETFGASPPTGNPHGVIGDGVKRIPSPPYSVPSPACPVSTAFNYCRPSSDQSGQISEVLTDFVTSLTRQLGGNSMNPGTPTEQYSAILAQIVDQIGKLRESLASNQDAKVHVTYYGGSEGPVNYHLSAASWLTVRSKLTLPNFSVLFFHGEKIFSDENEWLRHIYEPKVSPVNGTPITMPNQFYPHINGTQITMPNQLYPQHINDIPITMPNPLYQPQISGTSITVPNQLHPHHINGTPITMPGQRPLRGYMRRNDKVCVVDATKSKIDRKTLHVTKSFEIKAGKDLKQMLEPRGIAVGPFGIVYIADTNNSRIQRYDIHSGTLDVFVRDKENLKWPVGLAVHPEGILVIERKPVNTVSLFNCAGIFVRILIKQLEKMKDICVDGYGRVIIVSSEPVKMITILVNVNGSDDGRDKYTFPCRRLDFPTAVSTDGECRFIYVADNKKHRIHVFDYTGATLRVFGWEDITPYPTGLFITASGDVVVIDNNKGLNVTFVSRVGTEYDSFEVREKTPAKRILSVAKGPSDMLMVLMETKAQCYHIQQIHLPSPEFISIANPIMSRR